MIVPKIGERFNELFLRPPRAKVASTNSYAGLLCNQYASSFELWITGDVIEI
ncbi:MAG: hypothetical protein U0V48_09875 [Anaerolineales bacterium]